MYLAIVILAILVLALAGAWLTTGDPLTDDDLYGMSADEYLKKQVGEDYYNEHYK